LFDNVADSAATVPDTLLYSANTDTPPPRADDSVMSVR
jgi:hypothetical protein